MNFTKENNVIKWIKYILTSLAIIAAIIIAIEYLSSIQLLWVAILCLAILFSYDLDKLRNDVFSTRGKLGDWNIFRSTVDTDDDIKMYKYRNISVKELFSNKIISKKLETEQLRLRNLKIINCSGLSYVVFYDEKGTERILIGIEELSDLLLYLKYKNKYTAKDIFEAHKQITSEQNFISISITKREKLLKEYKEDNAEDFEIEEIEREISQLKKLLEQA
jgi:hypothetical protein